MYCHLSSMELEYCSLQRIQEHCIKTVFMLYWLKATGIKMNDLTVVSLLNTFHAVTKNSN